MQNDVVDTVIGPPDYIEQVFNEGRQDMQEGQSPLPRKDHDLVGTAYLPLTAMSVLSSRRGASDRRTRRLACLAGRLVRCNHER